MVLADKIFVKVGVFYKKSPCVQPQGPNSERNLYAPPKSSYPSPMECESIVFCRFLQIVDKQDF